MEIKCNKAKIQKIFFLIIVAVSFMAIYIYNVFTPLMSDDLLFDGSIYNSWVDIFKNEYERYLTWNGRSVLQIIMTISYLSPKWIFNIANSVCFVLLNLLIYWNIEGRKRYDSFLYVLINLFLWNFSVDFAQTILWVGGACNYLWGMVIILGFITLYRYLIKENMQKAGLSFLTLVTGILAGWGNENTSGGAILIVGCFSVLYFWKKKKIETYMLTGILGQIIGFGFLLLAPGNAVRGAVMKEGERYSGLSALVSRGLKVLESMQDYLFIYMAIICVLGVYFYYTKYRWYDFLDVAIFVIAALATAAVLIMTPEPMGRAYFGANIYMMIAAIQMIQKIREEDILLVTLRNGGIIAAVIWMCFVYVEEGSNLVRINRDIKQRETYIYQQVEAGERNLVLPMLHPQFETKYSYAHENDISMDEEWWINEVICIKYDLDSITAVEWEEWETN